MDEFSSVVVQNRKIVNVHFCLCFVNCRSFCPVLLFVVVVVNIFWLGSWFSGWCRIQVNVTTDTNDSLSLGFKVLFNN